MKLTKVEAPFLVESGKRGFLSKPRGQAHLWGLWKQAYIISIRVYRLLEILASYIQTS
jgi:hypothetical protein